MRRDAIDELYRSYAPMVYKYLRCLTHDSTQAEDLTADTFEAALRGIDQLRQPEKLPMWLCGIAKRLYYGELRRRSRVRELPLEDVPLISEQDIEREYVQREEKLDFYRALQTLDAHTREVFYLRLTGDMTFEEIGGIMGRTGNWARVTFYRGKEKMKRRLQDDGA